jgi:hypothetical protein
MKKFLPILSIAIVMAACNQAPKINSANTESPVAQNTISADTAGLASFQLWKAQNELADMNQYNQPVQAAPQAARQVVVYRDAPVKKVSTPKRSSSSSSSNSGVSNNSGSGESTSSNEAQAPAAKKGISKAAKGAIIGGVAGGVAGAVINKKNRGAGAVIGAVIGAGGGYVIGRGQDKKDGRVTGTSTPPFSIPTGILQK